MQHYFLCNISYVVIAESMGKSLKYTIWLGILSVDLTQVWLRN